MDIGPILRSLPEFKGKKRLARFLLGSKLDNLKDITVNGQYGRFLVPNIKEAIGFELYINGAYEPHIIELLKSLLPHNGHMLDIGANIGTIAIPLCKLMPGIKVVGVEASPTVFSYLEKNVALNAPISYDILNKAVTQKNGQMITFFSPDVMFGKGSQSNVYSSSSHSIESITINSLANIYFNNSIDVIKIDIEGYEYYAFMGGEQLLNQPSAPVILFEFLEWAESKSGVKPGSAQKLLLEYGYSLYLIRNNQKHLLESPVEKGDAMLMAIKSK
ncbi:MAG: FkbM family methyltransferase [Ferruginibacter sp.]|nr:FkbM family methyltransferase [Ferruginibacter sp.]